MSASVENKVSSHSSNFSSNLGSKIASAKLFVVGAGGIGCELLKNLVLVGFKDIHVVSIDDHTSHIKSFFSRKPAYRNYELNV